MKSSFATVALAALLAPAQPILAAEDFIDRLDDYLAVSAFHGHVQAKVSGQLDLEGYWLEQPPPGLIYTDRRSLVNPRLTLFFDAQVGPYVYVFAQARLDRGFDPSDSDAEVRLDEFAVRISPSEDGRLSLQVGRFATIAGNWIARHYSWDNPFINAPVPYGNLTGIWDVSAPGSSQTLLAWAHVPTPEYPASDSYGDKYLRNPIVWGPSYATGVSVFGKLGKFEYAAEMKNAPLSSRPESWDLNEIGFDHPTFTTRFGFRPNPTWNFGVSGSAGAYLRPEAASSLPAGHGIGDYQQLVIAQDVSFEWHRLQVWAEFYEARFEVPVVGNADTFAWYLEAKYKFTPQFFGALRWNQQLFGAVPIEDQDLKWGRDLWRIDAALGYRFTPHTQLKVQYGLTHEDSAPKEFSHLFAGQLTVSFSESAPLKAFAPYPPPRYAACTSAFSRRASALSSRMIRPVSRT